MNKKIIISLPVSILEEIPKHDQEDWIMDAIIEKLARMSESEILEKKSDAPSNNNNDQDLYQKMYQDLDPNGVIVRFLRDEDVGGLLWTEDLRAIHYFVEKWNHTQFEFLDPAIEKYRKNFMESLSRFSNELKANTWLSRHDENLSSMEAPDYDLNHPKWKKVDEINQLGTQTFKFYEDLVRILKRKLGSPIEYIKSDKSLTVTNVFSNANIRNFAGEVKGNQISDHHNH